MWLLCLIALVSVKAARAQTRIGAKQWVNSNFTGDTYPDGGIRIVDCIET